MVVFHHELQERSPFLWVDKSHGRSRIMARDIPPVREVEGQHKTVLVILPVRKSKRSLTAAKHCTPIPDKTLHEASKPRLARREHHGAPSVTVKLRRTGQHAHVSRINKLPNVLTHLPWLHESLTEEPE